MVTGVERLEIVAGIVWTWLKVSGITYVIMKKLEDKDKFSFAVARMLQRNMKLRKNSRVV